VFSLDGVQEIKISKEEMKKKRWARQQKKTYQKKNYLQKSLNWPVKKGTAIFYFKRSQHEYI
jgi:hypothetical protein